MEWFLIANAILMLGGFGLILKKVRPASQAQPKVLKAPAPEEHKLVKTWIQIDSMDTLDGWRAKCSCGTVSPASGLKSATRYENGSLGSEQSAIQKFEVHAKNFRRANGNAHKVEYDKLKAEFDEYKKSCYCKDVSSVELVPLKG